MNYGYARVSTKEQNEQRQIIALKESEIPLQKIYVDKQSGKDFNRQNYQNMLRKIKSGDTLVIKSIDRLGRNYEEILEQWRIITKEKMRGNCGAGYAVARYAKKSGSDRYPDCRYRVAAALLCGADRARFYPPETGGGDCCCESKWGAVWEKADGTSARI